MGIGILLIGICALFLGLHLYNQHTKTCEEVREINSRILKFELELLALAKETKQDSSMETEEWKNWKSLLEALTSKSFKHFEWYITEADVDKNILCNKCSNKSIGSLLTGAHRCNDLLAPSTGDVARVRISGTTFIGTCLNCIEHDFTKILPYAYSSDAFHYIESRSEEVRKIRDELSRDIKTIHDEYKANKAASKSS
ncbi:MAG: hypothetical protein KAS32_30170 [Candidatus Peribacteraceae bacterium]|nr:hypothetical protein [Candidatus Peribacteraceae bacterium]